MSNTPSVETELKRIVDLLVCEKLGVERLLNKVHVAPPPVHDVIT